MARPLRKRTSRKAVGSNPYAENAGRTSAPSGEIGATGLRQWSGYVREEFLTELQGEKGRKIFREMADNDATIGGMFSAITLLARQVDWRIEGEETDPRVPFLGECLHDMEHPWHDLIAEILRGMLTFGWSVHECVYKVRQAGRSQYTDNLIGWAKLPVRAQESLLRWIFEPQTNHAVAMVQLPPPDYKERTIPLDKCVHFRTEAIKDNPEGRSILRNAYRSWYNKKNIENIEGVGIERDLAGLPVIYAPAKLFEGANSAVLDELKNIATNIRRDEQEGVVMPMAYDESGHQLYKLELLSAGGERQFDTNAIITRYDQRILMTALADFLLLGHEKVGSFALSSDKTNLFSVSLGAWLDEIAAIFNRRAIPKLLALNGMDIETPPALIHGDVEIPDLQVLGAFLTSLKNAGLSLFPDLVVENKMREILGLETLTQEEYDGKEAEREAQMEAERDHQIAMSQRANAPANGEKKPPTQGKVAPTQPHRLDITLTPKENPPPVVQVAAPDMSPVGQAVALALHAVKDALSQVAARKQEAPVVHVAAPTVQVAAPVVQVNTTELAQAIRESGARWDVFLAWLKSFLPEWMQRTKKPSGLTVDYQGGKPVGLKPKD